MKEFTAIGVITVPTRTVPDTDTAYKIEPVALPCPKEQQGNGLFLAQGLSVPRVLGAMYREAIVNGFEIVPVQIAFEATVSPSTGSIKTVDDIKSHTIFDTRNISKQGLPIVSAIWSSWLKSDEPSAKIVAQPWRKEITKTNDLLGAIAEYPAFLHYLAQQEPFTHIEGSLFKYSMQGKLIVTLCMHRIPKHMKGTPLCSKYPATKIEWPAEKLLP